MKYDSWRPPSRPHTTFPRTRRYGHGPARAATTSRQSLQRHARSTLCFRLYRRGGRYPAIIRLWENAWAEFVPFLRFDREIRTVICTTNAIVISSLN